MTDVEEGGGEDAARDFEFTETSHQSYGSKLKDACSGVLIGFLLFAGSIGLLVYNEGRAVKMAKDLDEGQELVIETNLTDLINATAVSVSDENGIREQANSRHWTSDNSRHA